MKEIYKKSHLDIAREVIFFEINSLQKVLSVLDTRFNNCVQEILNVKGHVIVSGVGKSGIIGRKIAATFAATGTPALFMHPTDATHGDLGTITSNSLLFLVSKSGNTTELSPIIQYAEFNNIPIISITGNNENFLYKNYFE